MAIVRSSESRAESRDLYVPAPRSGMAHRSYVSPDGKWVLVVEMDDKGVWLPCRLLPIDGGCFAVGWTVKGPVHRRRLVAGRTMDVFQR